MCSGCGYTRFEVIGSYRVFLQRAVFDVCAVAGSFAICHRLHACCHHCCHVRRYMRACHRAVQIALQWMHQGSSLLRLRASYYCLLQLGIGHRKSYWSGCIQVAILICQKIFSILALVIFLFEFLPKSASKSVFRLGTEIRFWSYNFCCRCS